VDPERWTELLFYSHPAMGKRIERGRTFGEGERKAHGAEA
jgi:hypothetical protein